MGAPRVGGGRFGALEVPMNACRVVRNEERGESERLKGER